jgi:predicted anti-sigma-YlaC factor YlaD
MTCAEVRRFVPGYLDGALPERFGRGSRARMGLHLQGCQACRQELQRYVQLSALMAGITPAPAPPPDNLAVGIRVALAQARAEQGLRGKLTRWKNRVQLILENILEPLAVPATGGLLAALVVFVIVYHQFIGVGMSLGVNVADLPNNLLQPARLETLAGFRMSQVVETESSGQHPLLLKPP